MYSNRLELNLSGNRPWKVWLDKEAEWKNDKLYLPDEFELSEMPLNKPSCGWMEMYNSKGENCKLPTTVEEQFGTSHDWIYNGVSWFYTTFNLTDEWNGKSVWLDIEKYNHRVEVFINEKLVGYDAVGLLPYKCDISSALVSGENRIALRITSAGGIRGWGDFRFIKWGEYYLLPDKDYSGVGGKVSITGVDKTYISDIFVKNVLPAKANNIEIEADVIHNYSYDTEGKYTIEIVEKSSGNVLFCEDFNCYFQKGSNSIKRKIQVPQAKLWSEHSPEIYECRMHLKTINSADSKIQDFGFRIFEVKEVDNKTHFYLNDKRIRFRSSIDWGIYAFNGLFPTKDAALRSVMAVKSVGHNSLNFHRRAGDISLMDYADSLGVYIYEEPGGFHSGGQANCNVDTFRFAKGQILERLKRMVIRDRNHPSLMIYSLCNEDNRWTLTREYGMRLIHKLDPTRLIINSSGGDSGGYSYGGVPHIRPYEDEIRLDYNDNHTVKADVSLNESDLNKSVSQFNKDPKQKVVHVSIDSTAITYWGEVRCYAGTFNYPLIYSQGIANTKGYDLSMYSSQALKVKDLFERCNLKGMGNGDIQSEFDLTKYAGQGQYYSNGRLGQVIMSNNFSDGYAINGWTPGPDLPNIWSSAMLDQNRNMNSYGENISYWNRPLQIAIMRTNGKYVNPGDSIKVNIFLINENLLEKGDYTLSLKIKDGAGKYVNYNNKIKVKVIGGDVFAQTIATELAIEVKEKWTSGYITIEGKLFKQSKVVADGMEQVLLQNRSSQYKRLSGSRISVLNWNGAEKALVDAGIKQAKNIEKSSVILLGTRSTEENWDKALKAVYKGANLIIQLDSIDAVLLYKKGLINKPIENWGGIQTSFWNGNGSSYIDVFGGSQVHSKSGIISTRSWEASGNPRGFYPFSSDYKLKTYGLYFAHQFKTNPKFSEQTNTLVTYGEIQYGKGRILLNTSYWVDNNNAFCDLLFYNILSEYL